MLALLALLAVWYFAPWYVALLVTLLLIGHDE